MCNRNGYHTHIFGNSGKDFHLKITEFVLYQWHAIIKHKNVHFTNVVYTVCVYYTNIHIKFIVQVENWVASTNRPLENHIIERTKMICETLKKSEAQIAKMPSVHTMSFTAVHRLLPFFALSSKSTIILSNIFLQFISLCCIGSR